MSGETKSDNSSSTSSSNSSISSSGSFKFSNFLLFCVFFVFCVFLFELELELELDDSEDEEDDFLLFNPFSLLLILLDFFLEFFLFAINLLFIIFGSVKLLSSKLLSVSIFFKYFFDNFLLNSLDFEFIFIKLAKKLFFDKICIGIIEKVYLFLNLISSIKGELIKSNEIKLLIIIFILSKFFIFISLKSNNDLKNKYISYEELFSSLSYIFLNPSIHENL